MKHNIYPFHVKSFNEFSFEESTSELARTIWERVRKLIVTKVVWYSVDLSVTSEDSVILRIYDIKDTTFGGTGECILSLVVNEFTLWEITELKKEIQKRQLAYSKKYVEDQDRLVLEARIQITMTELFSKND
jgi:hypothetical protein